jgi:Zn-dependent protease
VIASACARCGTELAPAALACPACATLRYTDRLKALAADAESARDRGDREVAHEHWMTALTLLPPHSVQHERVRQHLADLVEAVPPDQSGRTAPRPSTWRRAIGAATMAFLVLAGKLKFLILGLTKVSTFASMFAFFGLYWSVYGWPLALGLVLSIYIHEMGHVAMLRRFGIAAGAPLFIPGVGAIVMLKQHVLDPVADARIGLAGPVWGLGAAVAALVVYYATGARIWLAIAELTGLINLFNLIPIWQLDGARGFHSLGLAQRWIVVAVTTTALLLTGQRMLFLVGAVAVWRALQTETGPGDTQTVVTFAILILALSALAAHV